MVYIDLNMVRAGVVKHPGEWPWCGYHEIQNPRRRGSGIDFENLIALYGAPGIETLQEACRRNIDTVLEAENRNLRREGCWSEAVAVGGEVFVRQVRDELGPRGDGRKGIETVDRWELRETASSYIALFQPEKVEISPENRLLWKAYPDDSFC